MAKLIVAFHSFVNVPKIDSLLVDNQGSVVFYVYEGMKKVF